MLQSAMADEVNDFIASQTALMALGTAAGRSQQSPELAFSPVPNHCRCDSRV